MDRWTRSGSYRVVRIGLATRGTSGRDDDAASHESVYARTTANSAHRVVYRGLIRSRRISHAGASGDPSLVLLRFNDHVRRPTLTHYARPLRYRTFRLDDITGAYNEFGSIVAFQPVGRWAADASAQDVYEDDALFDTLYPEAVRSVRGALGVSERDIRFSFRLSVGSEVGADWDWARITDDDTEAALLVEAVLIFLLCSRTEQLLAGLPETRRSERRQKLLVEYAEGLFGLERPEQFLVNQAEIEKMDTLYRAWDLSTHVRVAKERVGQSITNISFFAEHKEKAQANLMNLLLGAIAVLSAAEVVPDVLETATGTPAPVVTRALVIAAVMLVAWAVGRYVLAPVAERTYHAWVDRQASRKLSQRPTVDATAKAEAPRAAPAVRPRPRSGEGTANRHGPAPEQDGKSEEQP